MELVGVAGQRSLWSTLPQVEIFPESTVLDLFFKPYFTHRLVR
jgi:hypothetical protein